jgi:uncharacterized membrane protein
MSEKRKKLLAPFLMLLAGAVASIYMFVKGFEPQRMLGILLFVLLLFYILGGIINYILTRFEEQNEALMAELLAEEAAEGEVFEKEYEEGEEGAENAEYSEEDAEPAFIEDESNELE